MASSEPRMKISKKSSESWFSRRAAVIRQSRTGSARKEEMSQAAWFNIWAKGKVRPYSLEDFESIVLMSVTFGWINRLEELLNSCPLSFRNDVASHLRTENSLIGTAASGGHLAVVKYLVQSCKADPDDLNWEPFSLEFDEESEKGVSAFWLACFKDHLPIVTFLLETAKARVDHTDHAGNNGLHIACAMGHQKIAEYLIGKGCLLTHENHSRLTALQVAIDYGHTSICTFALKNKPAQFDVNHQSSVGYSLLHHVAGTPAIKIALEIVEAGGKLDMRGRGGVTPLELMVTYDDQENIRKILGNPIVSVEAKILGYELMGVDYYDKDLRKQCEECLNIASDLRARFDISCVSQSSVSELTLTVEMNDKRGIFVHSELELKVQMALMKERMFGLFHKKTIYFLQKFLAQEPTLRCARLNLEVIYFMMTGEMNNIRTFPPSLLNTVSMNSIDYLTQNAKVFLESQPNPSFPYPRDRVLAIISSLSAKLSLETAHWKEVKKRGFDTLFHVNRLRVNVERIFYALLNVIVIHMTYALKEKSPTMKEELDKEIRHVIRVNHRDSIGNNILQCFAWKGTINHLEAIIDCPIPHVDIAKLLIQCGANVHNVNQDRQTLMHTLSRCEALNTPEMLLMFLEKGVHWDFKDNQGENFIVPGNFSAADLMKLSPVVKKQMTLQCFAAGEVKRHFLPVAWASLPEHLRLFIEHH
jgi:ankyrin repeat protein